MEKEKRIVANSISKKFKIGYRKNQSALGRFSSLFSGREPQKTIEALKNVSFEVSSGEILGIVGDNGSGKSTLLRIIAGIYKTGKGEIITRGKIISFINLAAGLKERLTMKENIFLGGSLFGVGQKELKEKFDSIVEFSGLREFVNTKIYQFSGGMRQRLAFSIVIRCSPEVLLLDEVFEIGDEDFRKKSADKIKELVKGGASVVLVSHDLDMIRKYCNRVIWLDGGKIIQQGSPEEIINKYLK